MPRRQIVDEAVNLMQRLTRKEAETRLIEALRQHTNLSGALDEDDQETADRLDHQIEVLTTALKAWG